MNPTSMLSWTGEDVERLSNLFMDIVFISATQSSSGVETNPLWFMICIMEVNTSPSRDPLIL